GLGMTARHRRRNRLQSLPQAEYVTFAGLPTDGLVGTAVDEQDAAGDRFAALRIGQRVTDHGQVVILLWQRRVGLTPPLLLQRQVTGPLPVELIRLAVVQSLVVLPGH